MKILCVCQEGNKRSVVTRFILNHTSHEALAIGTKTNSEETIRLMAGWADVILLAEPEMEQSIPMWAHMKINKSFTIGPDIYPNSIDKKLRMLITNQLKELGYI